MMSSKFLSLLFALALGSPALSSSVAEKVAELRKAPTAVDRVKLLPDDSDVGTHSLNYSPFLISVSPVVRLRLPSPRGRRNTWCGQPRCICQLGDIPCPHRDGDGPDNWFPWSMWIQYSPYAFSRNRVQLCCERDAFCRCIGRERGTLYLQRSEAPVSCDFPQGCDPLRDEQRAW